MAQIFWIVFNFLKKKKNNQKNKQKTMPVDFLQVVKWTLL